MTNLDAAINRMQKAIENESKDMSDEDFIDFHEALASFCDVVAAARREELEVN